MPVIDSNYYYVQPKCTEGTGLVLGAADPTDYDAKVVLVPLSSDLGIWRLEGVGNGDELTFSPHLHFRARYRRADDLPTDGFLKSHYGDKPAEILGAPESGYWYTIDTWHLVPSGPPPWVAIQLAREPRQNLNVGGDGPYPPGSIIYSYHWSDGQPNELWKVMRQCYADGSVASVGDASFVIDDVHILTNAFTDGVSPIQGQRAFVEGIRVDDYTMVAVKIR